SFEDGVVQAGVGCEDADVALEAAALGPIERQTIDVADPAAGLLDDEPAGGVVPDVFAILRCSGIRRAQVDLGLAGGDAGVLGLAVHADRLRPAAERPLDLGGEAVIGVTRFDALGQPRAGRLRLNADPHRP